MDLREIKEKLLELPFFTATTVAVGVGGGYGIFKGMTLALVASDRMAILTGIGLLLVGAYVTASACKNFKAQILDRPDYGDAYGAFHSILVGPGTQPYRPSKAISFQVKDALLRIATFQQFCLSKPEDCPVGYLQRQYKKGKR